MAQKPIELILFRQLAYCLALPIFIADTEGNLIYYNEEAEKVLGIKYSETGEIPSNEWTTIFDARDENGVKIPPEKLPLVIAFSQRRPAHSTFYVTSKDTNTTRLIYASTFPIINQLGVFVGAASFFPEKKS